jgi:SAM-dependent methyltransferase
MSDVYAGASEAYTRSARYYDAIFGSIRDYPAQQAALLDSIISERAQLPGKSLLDVACGTGWHMWLMERLGYGVEGIDSSAEQLAVAMQRIPEERLHLGDMRAIHTSHVFDVVTCLFGPLAHMPSIVQMRKAVASMASVLAPGGLLIIEPWAYCERPTCKIRIVETKECTIIRSGRNDPGNDSRRVDYRFDCHVDWKNGGVDQFAEKIAAYRYSRSNTSERSKQPASGTLKSWSAAAISLRVSAN